MRVIQAAESMVDRERDEVAAPRIVGDSWAMRELQARAARIAPRDVTVLVRGETGTGKELITSLIHARSARAHAPLVRFNCAAVSAELAEAELFGHARGAFTGAHQTRAGFFQVANGGTVVLDEIGEMPLPMQAKLLRVLQNGEIQQVGASRTERVDVRVIACTNRDLQQEAQKGRFRMDLYFRLAVVELVVPPLRERRDDIPLLASEFARQCARRFGTGDVRLSPALVEALRQQDWPGNVRQLENAIVRMLAMTEGEGEIGVEALSPDAAPIAAAPAPAIAVARADALGSRISLRDQVDALERTIIARTLSATAGNRSETARRLGLSRTSVLYLLKKHGLDGSAEVANAEAAS